MQTEKILHEVCEDEYPDLFAYMLRAVAEARCAELTASTLRALLGGELGRVDSVFRSRRYQVHFPREFRESDPARVLTVFTVSAVKLVRVAFAEELHSAVGTCSGQEVFLPIAQLTSITKTVYLFCRDSYISTFDVGIGDANGVPVVKVVALSQGIEGRFQMSFLSEDI